MGRQAGVGAAPDTERRDGVRLARATPRGRFIVVAVERQVRRGALLPQPARP
jgi:hypothetical protein